MKQFAMSVVPVFLLALPLGAQTPGSEITKWQDGKDACVSITYDDSTPNQFRIAIPLMNERRLPGTFFIITGDIEGSKYQPAFAGRPIATILRESAIVPTNKDNFLERSSLLNYLQMVQEVPELKGFRAQSLQRNIAQANIPALAAVMDPLLEKLRATGVNYPSTGRSHAVSHGPNDPVRDWPGDTRYPITWDEIRRHMAEGHEMANHSITHPYMPVMDAANIAYELDKSKQEMLEQLGPKSQFSVECPFAISDPRVKDVTASKFPITRNWVLDDFMGGVLRGDNHDPTQIQKEYVQWQRETDTATKMEEMQRWVDVSQAHGLWLITVTHGIQGIGYQPVTSDTLRTYFDYLADRQDHLWVATFQDGAKYARERHNGKITTKASGDRIEVTVTHSLDKSLYDLPLTVKTPIPADWKLAHFQQGQDARWLPVHHDGDAAYVLYRIAPNGPPATLEKAAN
jgi:peptidoglycan/xylan/chitin deacetylase (PgdA/CDA1 family)